eukprot:gene5823-14173_t
MVNGVAVRTLADFARASAGCTSLRVRLRARGTTADRDVVVK